MYNLQNKNKFNIAHYNLEIKKEERNIETKITNLLTLINKNKIKNLKKIYDIEKSIKYPTDYIFILMFIKDFFNNNLPIKKIKKFLEIIFKSKKISQKNKKLFKQFLLKKNNKEINKIIKQV